MKLLHPTACDFMVQKDYKNWFKIYLSSMWNQLQDPAHHLSSYRSSCHYLSRYFFEVPPMRVSSLYLPSAFDHTHADHFYCFRSSSRKTVQTGLSEPKIIFLYPMMVSLMASSSSSFVFRQFRWGIFNFVQVLTVMSCLFIILVL